MILYEITNSITGKRYIGKCKRSLVARWTKHLKAVADGSMYAIHCAIRKYGKDSFVIREISRHSSDRELIEAEIAAIAKFSTLVPNGYNMTRGGEGGAMLGHKHSPETIAKMRAKKNSPETIERMRQAQRKRTDREEVCRKMQEGRQRKLASGWKPDSSGMRTPESIEKMRRAKTGRPAWNKGKHIPSLRGNKHALGYRHTEEAKARIGAAAVGNKYAARGTDVTFPRLITVGAE